MRSGGGVSWLLLLLSPRSCKTRMPVSGYAKSLSRIVALSPQPGLGTTNVNTSSVASIAEACGQTPNLPTARARSGTATDSEVTSSARRQDAIIDRSPCPATGQPRRRRSRRSRRSWEEAAGSGGGSSNRRSEGRRPRGRVILRLGSGRAGAIDCINPDEYNILILIFFTVMHFLILPFSFRKKEQLPQLGPNSSSTLSYHENNT